MGAPETAARGFLLDTNVVAEMLRPHGNRRVKAWLRAQVPERLFISVLTLAEYEKGLSNLYPEEPARAQIAETLARIERTFAGRVLPLADAVVRRWGRISGEANRRAGKAPPPVDALLAATALEHDLVLVTRNVRDIADLGVTVFDPWARSRSARRP
jgi:predicted nucleic acid-binding protein